MKIAKLFIIALSLTWAAPSWALPKVLNLSGNIEMEDLGAVAVEISLKRYRNTTKRQRYKGVAEVQIPNHGLITRDVKFTYNKRKKIFVGDININSTNHPTRRQGSVVRGWIMSLKAKNVGRNLTSGDSLNSQLNLNEYGMVYRGHPLHGGSHYPHRYVRDSGMGQLTIE